MWAARSRPTRLRGSAESRRLLAREPGKCRDSPCRQGLGPWDPSRSHHRLLRPRQVRPLLKPGHQAAWRNQATFSRRPAWHRRPVTLALEPSFAVFALIARTCAWAERSAPGFLCCCSILSRPNRRRQQRHCGNSLSVHRESRTGERASPLRTTFTRVGQRTSSLS